MTEIIERAERILQRKNTSLLLAGLKGVVPELIAELKAAQIGLSNANILLAKAAEDYDKLVKENERLESEYVKAVAPKDYWGNPLCSEVTDD